MIDLGLDLGGLELKNPIVVAAGDIGCHLNQIKEAEHYGAAAFITKGCIPRPEAAGLGRKARFRLDLKRGAFTGMAGFHRQSLDQAVKLISEAKKEVRIPIGANIFVMSPDDEEQDSVTRAAEAFFNSGADFIELDTTGNLPVHFGETGKSSKTGEAFLDQTAIAYPGFVHDCIQSVKAVVDVPVISKVAYENLNVPVLLKAMEEAGVDIIDVGNAGMGVMPGIINIYDPEDARGGFVSADKNLGLCLTGNPLRAVSQAYLIRSAKHVRTPILACGGIMKWWHVVEAIMCGAGAAAICTAFMIHGFEIIKDMLIKIQEFMDAQGYRSLVDFRGAFLDKIALTPSEIEVHDALARLDPEKCNGCGLCTKPAHCGRTRRAIDIQDGIAFIDDSQCIGCETCASICPVNAIYIQVQN